MKKLLLSALLLAACSSGSAPQIELLDGPNMRGPESADVHLVRDPMSGDVIMSWVEGDSSGYVLSVARSGDGGRTWSEAVAVTTAPEEVKPHAEASPRLVAAGGVLGVVWSRQYHVPGRRFPASEMRFARSTDGGRTWSAPITLNDDTAGGMPAGHTFHGATAVGDSAFIVAWLDSRQVNDDSHNDHSEHAQHNEGSSYVFSTASYDLGATWQPANRKHWGSACPCCRVSLAATADDVLAAWRGHFDGDVRDIVIARLAQDEQPERVHVDNWVFPACPHSGPGLAVNRQDVHLAWFTGAAGRMGVYYTKLGSDPVPVVKGEALPTGHPSVAPLATGALVAVNLNSQAQRALTISHVRNDNVTTTEVADTDGADHPQLLRVGDNEALVAWTQNGRVRLARVTVD